MKLPISLDNDSLNELQILSKNEDTLRLSKSNFIILPENWDNDSTNELQTLSYRKDSIKISNGNSISLKSLKYTQKKYSLGIDSTVGGYIFKLTPDSLHGLVFSLDFDTINKYTYTSSFDAILDSNNYYGIGKNFIDWELPNVKQLELILNTVDFSFKAKGAFLSSSPYFHLMDIGGHPKFYVRGTWYVYWDESSLTPKKYSSTSNGLGLNPWNILPIRKF